MLELLVNSAARRFLMVAGFEGQCLRSFLYLLMRSLTIFGSAGIQQLFLESDIPSCLKLLFASTLQLGCTEGPWIGKKIIIFAWSCRQVANLIISVLLFGRGRHGSVLKSACNLLIFPHSTNHFRYLWRYQCESSLLEQSVQREECVLRSCPNQFPAVIWL